MENETAIDLAERVAVLETEWSNTKDDLKEIKGKLDDLLHLKSKGMGALGLVSLLIGSGMIGLVITIVNIFRQPHL
jgi:hypothetical protein